MKKRKTVRVNDEKNDDFAALDIKAETVGADYRYVRRAPLWLAAEFVLYRIIATPLVFLMAKILFGLRIKNRGSVRKLKKTGFFLYGNHTQNMMDAYTPSLVSFPRRAHIVTGPEAVSIKGIRAVVAMLGAIPLPSVTKGYAPFRKALGYRINERRAVTIYPEAHIWPWYTGIRDFSDASFDYPAEFLVPCVAFATTFRRRKIFKNRHPYLTVTLSDPIFPDESLPRAERRRDMRDRVYAFMKETVSSPDNYAFVKYEKDGSWD
ncbi:MAG: hypothetical protein IKG80_02795 [Clostridia bacterium]|nr:hypothetical protein [Clostridia bacterium]